MLSIRARSEHIQGCNFQVCIHVRVNNVPHGDFFSTRALKIEVPSISDTLRAIDKLKVADSIHLVPSCVSYLRPFEQIKILLRVLGLPVSGSREDLLKTLEYFIHHVESLFQRRCRVVKRGYYLIQAIKSNCVATVKQYLALGSDPNYKGSAGTALEVAISGGSLQLVVLLISFGADAHRVNECGVTMYLLIIHVLLCI